MNLVALGDLVKPCILTCDSEWDSFRAGACMRRWYRGDGLLVLRFSQFLPTGGVTEKVGSSQRD